MNWIPIILILALAVFWLWMQSRQDRALFRNQPGSICENRTATSANQWLQQHPETQVLDVRSPGEHAQGALPGALNICISDPEFGRRVSALDKSLPVLVYCAGGFRSRKAAAQLKRLGFSNIQHLHRGYMSWSPEA